jgi:exodeoxyribonuclease-3
MPRTPKRREPEEQSLPSETPVVTKPSKRSRGSRKAPVTVTEESSTSVTVTEQVASQSGSDSLTTTAQVKMVVKKYSLPTLMSALKFTTYDHTKHLKIMSWNVNGIRAVLRKDAGALTKLCASENPDLLFLQETKVDDASLEKEVANDCCGLYHGLWNCCTEKKGYSGTAVFVRNPEVILSQWKGFLPDDPDFAELADSQGRVVTVELPHLYVCGVYTPNSGDGLKNLDFRTKVWEPKMALYLSKLDRMKPVVYCGDLNVAHKEIDIHDPKHNLRSAGFTVEERSAFSALLDEFRMKDAFREVHGPEHQEFTYFGFRYNGRATNKGWRLDYHVVSERLMPAVEASYILRDVVGSDHVPVVLVLDREKVQQACNPSPQ